MNRGRRSLIAAGLTLPFAAPALARAAVVEPGPAGASAPLVELRQYTLRKGQRDVLARMFDLYFRAGHEQLGCHVLGTFRDLDDPDRFVWMREFADLDERKRILEGFYYGPVWKAHRTEANATIVDSDNVLLLRRLANPGGAAPAALDGAPLEAAIHYLGKADKPAFLAFFDAEVEPRLAAAGAAPLARFISADVPNNFPRLPVREADEVFVRISAAPRKPLPALPAGWRDGAPETVLPAFMRKPERLRLAPTPRSG